MDNMTKQYRQAELLAAVPLTAEKVAESGINLQIQTSHGKTKWFRLTAEEFRKIELVLTGEL
jgi:hypothetical protein